MRRSRLLCYLVLIGKDQFTIDCTCTVPRSALQSMGSFVNIIIIMQD